MEKKSQWQTPPPEKKQQDESGVESYLTMAKRRLESVVFFFFFFSHGAPAMGLQCPCGDDSHRNQHFDFKIGQEVVDAFVPFFYIDSLTIQEK